MRGDDDDGSDHSRPFPKHCRCGASYDEAAWKALVLVGVDVDSALEFRNCRCGSTLAIPHEEELK